MESPSFAACQFSAKEYYVVALFAAICPQPRFQSALLQPQGTLEVESVIARLRLRDGIYERGELDERQVLGLEGVVKISNVVHDDMRLLPSDGFAPAS